MSQPVRAFQSEVLREDALNSSSTQPVYLSTVEVNGGDHFSRHFFSKLLTPLTEKSDYTLQQLISEVDKSCDNLVRTSMFNVIKPSLHVDYTHKAPEKDDYNTENPIVTKVVLDLVSKDLSAGGLGLGFNNEDNTIVKLDYLNNNMNHNAELVKIGVNYQPYKPVERLLSTMRIQSSLKHPLFKFIADVTNSHENDQRWKQCFCKSTGGLIGVLYSNVLNTVSMFNGVSLLKHSIEDVKTGTRDDVKLFEGTLVRSSLISKLTYDTTTRHNGYHNEGLQLSLDGQLSAYQASKKFADNQVGFMKLTSNMSFYKSIFNNAITAHVFKEAGAIFCGDSSKKIHIADRFYLGGFENFKGFSRNGVNESGGLQFYKFGATVHGKIPIFLHPKLNPDSNPMRLYATTMVGNVGNTVMGDKGVLSSGFGLRYINELVNFDIGYYFAQRLDSNSDYGVRDGFQLELSLGGVGQTK